MTLEEHIHQTSFPSEQIKLMLHVQLVARQIVAVTRKVLTPYGLTPQQYNVLRILRGQKGRVMAVQALAERMVDPSSNASRLLDKLEAKDLIKRTVCPEDRRRADVVITEEGNALLNTLDVIIPPSMESIASTITEIKAGQLNADLEILLNACDDIIEKNTIQTQSK